MGLAEASNCPKGAPIMDARIEKLDTGFWLPAFTSARCVVPMRGYFEWTGRRATRPRTISTATGWSRLPA
ncbi:SOS response-associated peptidase family protein [Microbacterium sp. NPDC077486]|uniref:SOS response-associated peptidase family protein n=1 Tax=Microbacterium sp. NPDC077486 TaxID=3154766 RepID=UPI00341BF60D